MNIGKYASLSITLATTGAFLILLSRGSIEYEKTFFFMVMSVVSWVHHSIIIDYIKKQNK